MPFAIIGYSLGITNLGANIDLRILLPVILCMVFARNTAMAFNRYADRFIDAKNPRTKAREIPAGIVKPFAALIFMFVNAIAFIITCLYINILVFYLSPVALFVILIYSLTKKFTSLCHFVLGVGLSLAPIGAYLAVTGAFSILPIYFSIIVLLWTSGFDILYALADKDFDVQEKLHSIPASLGIKKAIFVSRFLHAILAILVITIGLVYFGIFYAIGAAVFIILLALQHIIVKPNDLSRLNTAFFTINGIASIIFAGFVVADLLVI
jgi:4-hydroxybenzoate polyprenyltransferase